FPEPSKIMPSYIEMPKLSDTMTEGTVVKWRKKPGDKVEIGDILAEIETDKAVMEMEAFDEGVFHEVIVQEGGKAQIGQKLAVLAKQGEKASDIPKEPQPSAAPAGKSPESPLTATEKAKKDTPPAKGSSAVASHSAPQASVQAPAPSGRIKASPLAKKIAGSNGVELGSISGTGPGGRIVAKDVESLAQGSRGGASKPVITSAIPRTQADKRIPLTGMRKIIAERLLVSKTQIPHFYLHIEVDAGELMRLRTQVNELGEKAGQPKLTVNDFVLKAAVMAAVKVPRVNASFDGDAVIEYGNVNMAVAVAIDDGLVTPVIREAQKKSIREISDVMRDLATRARSKKLKPEEYQGGTITLSNLGSLGIESFSAIINPPQAMILAVGAVVKKAVVNEQDEIVVGQRMSIGLSGDHRVVDGAVGAQYMAELRQLLESPLGLIL
ncbi:MAG TPA: pyruvate dehydrogenase complex dihydrolipoamide acetyltransferase, partial [Candidatus Saccharimonadales bacterium]|nr:pyruvate dehydrogenase complex dihydrolipoamide acetyltransferase [Candidatus Saccharimonadales bacterium]